MVQRKLEINVTTRPDGSRDLQIDMSPDVKAHLQHRIGQEEKYPDCIHCREKLALYKALGL